MKKKTPTTHDPMLKQYLREIGEFPLLSREEEVDLARRIQSGDSKALEKMINSNLRLVVRIATDFNGLGLELNDLIAEGNTGLMIAAERFDPDRGAKFSTYAILWIKQRIRRALSNLSRTIRLPVRVIAESAELARANASLYEELDRDPTAEELAEETGMPDAKIARLRSLPSACMSLDDTPTDDDDLTLAELIADESAVSPEEVVAKRWIDDELESAMPVLNDRERTIIERRFGLDGSEPSLLSDLGDRFDVTRERVRQVQNVGLKKLRERLGHLCTADEPMPHAVAC